MDPDQTSQSKNLGSLQYYAILFPVKNSDKFQSALNRVDIFLKRQKGTHDDL